MTEELGSEGFPNRSDLSPETSEQWATWLSAEEEKSFNAYRAKPELLIAEGIRERESTRDYEGREILELLQNANDAAADCGATGTVTIELHNDGLVVANTGAPFTTEGVSSLQTANLSPKRRRRRTFIGSKGLGFRAVLNWSQSPIIISGGLRLIFGPSHAQRRIANLINSCPAIADLVSKELRDSEFHPPVLTFPAFSLDGDISSLAPETPAAAILKRCQDLQPEGLSTVIGMPFDQPQALENALAQLRALTPELLLFVKHLRQITIRQLDERPATWKIEPAADTIKVTVNGEPHREWEVFSECRPIPPEHLDNDKSKATEYEIVVAIPKQQIARKFPLFSYFPTNVAFPLPIVCHATLELEQNRKHPQGGPANKFVLQRLACFIAEAAEAYVKKHPDQLWAGYDLLIPDGDFASDLNELDFKSQLLAAVSSKHICPSISGKMATPKSGKLMVPGTSPEWLPVIGFEDVIRCRNQRDWDFLKAMSSEVLSPAQIKERLLALTELTLDQRAALIVGLLEKAPTTLHSPALLLDQNGKTIPEDSRVFLAPSGGTKTEIPAWMEIRFLNAKLRSSLAEKLKCSEIRELQQKLSTFRVVEYSLDHVISALVAETNKRKKETPEKSDGFDADLLTTLFNLFPKDVPSEERNRFPNTTVRVPTQSGRFAEANNVYLGSPPIHLTA